METHIELIRYISGNIGITIGIMVPIKLMYNIYKK